MLQWTLRYMCLFQFSFPQGICQVLGLLVHMVVFWGIFLLSSIMTVSVYIPTNSAKGFPFLHTLSSIYWLMLAILTSVSNHLIFCHPLLLPPLVFPSIRVFSNESVLCIRCQSIGASASASVLPMTIQDWFPLDWLVWSPCSPRDFQESSPTPQSSKASIL